MAHDAPKIRLCILKKWPDFAGYGFNLHAEKGKAGQFIGKVDVNSPASKGGLKENDRVIEVNGDSVVSENHSQVVQRIKANPSGVELLVVDSEAEAYYAERGIAIGSHLSSSLVTYSCPDSRHEEPEITYGQSNGYGDHSEIREDRIEVTAEVIDSSELHDDIVGAAADAEVIEVEYPPPPPETLPPLDYSESEYDLPQHQQPEPSLPEEATVVEEPVVQAAPAPAPVAAAAPVVAPAPVHSNNNVSNDPPPRASAGQDSVDLNKMSAAEMRARIAAGSKRNAAKNTSQTFREKYDVFQSL